MLDEGERTGTDLDWVIVLMHSVVCFTIRAVVRINDGQLPTNIC